MAEATKGGGTERIAGAIGRTTRDGACGTTRDGEEIGAEIAGVWPLAWIAQAAQKRIEVNSRDRIEENSIQMYSRSSAGTHMGTGESSIAGCHGSGSAGSEATKAKVAVATATRTAIVTPLTIPNNRLGFIDS